MFVVSSESQNGNKECVLAFKTFKWFYTRKLLNILWSDIFHWINTRQGDKRHLVLIMKLPVITGLMTSHPIPVWTAWKSACGKCPEKHWDAKEEPKIPLEASQLKTIKSALYNYKGRWQAVVGSCRLIFHVHLKHLADFFLSVSGYENMPYCSDKTYDSAV